MPIYEYQCQACGNVVDLFQKHDDPPIKLCPECGEEAMNKLVSAPSFKLKGKGWYVTDFRDKDKNVVKNIDQKEGESSTKQEKSHEDKQETKTEATKKEVKQDTSSKAKSTEDK